MRILIAALLLLISAPSVANALDLRSPEATGETFVLNDERRRRAYALLEATEALPKTEFAVPQLAIHIENCLMELTGAQSGGVKPEAIENRKRLLSHLILDCVGVWGRRKFGKP